MISFDQFKNEWLGRTVDYDRVFQFQCVDLILQYVYECYGIASGVSGNAIDYWTKTGVSGFNATLLNKFIKVATTEAQTGDIVVMNGLPGNPYGHIGIATGNINGSDVEILEQNGQTGSGDGQGGNAIRVRYVARSRVAGLLRPITITSSPAVTPASGQTVHLPATVASWAVYRVGSGLRKGTEDQVGSLAPAQFGGLAYSVQGWIGNYAVIINTASYGQVAIWVKDTVAAISDTAATPPPPAPAAPVHPYTIENIPAKQIKFNKATHKWGLNYDNFTAISNNPEGNVDPSHDPITVVAILHHNIGYSYYLEDASVASGYNVVDCVDYTPPPPTPVKTDPPAAPVTAPSSETYELLKDLPGYVTSNMAINHDSPKVTIPIGTYFVFNKKLNGATLLAVNITKTPGKPGAWINTADNTLEPVAPVPDPTAVAEAAQKAADEAAAAVQAQAQAKADALAKDLPTPDSQYKKFPKSLRYVLMRDVNVFNLSSGKVIDTAQRYEEVWIEGALKQKGVTYGRLVTSDNSVWEGVPVIDPATNTVNLELYSIVYNPNTTLNDRQVTKTLSTGDYVQLTWRNLQKLYFGFTSLLGKIRASK